MRYNEFCVDQRTFQPLAGCPSCITARDKLSTMASDTPAQTNDSLSPLRQQLEFYFSDSNLAKDTFLRDRIKWAGGGWVKLTVLAGFKKVKSLGGTIEKLCDAANASEALELSHDRTSMRRSEPMPDTFPDFTRMWRTSIPIAGVNAMCPGSTDRICRKLWNKHESRLFAPAF